ncbi:MAG TPA: lipopolysaccharide assembly protein LapA domain-containing protein, partial [Gammaproteobacteria bacterium]|nr:lipopolysaccharide assembly protein LapA domain-containing protein [Gammaproteobacteria bacterium]
MGTVRKMVLILLLAVVVVAVVVFAYGNPGTMSLDVGVAKLQHVPVGTAFAAAFGCGWIMGLFSAALAMLKGAHERRRLKRSLRSAQEEVRSLRDLPLSDA